VKRILKYFFILILFFPQTIGGYSIVSAEEMNSNLYIVTKNTIIFESSNDSQIGEIVKDTILKSVSVMDGKIIFHFGNKEAYISAADATIYDAMPNEDEITSINVLGTITTKERLEIWNEIQDKVIGYTFANGKYDFLEKNEKGYVLSVGGKKGLVLFSESAIEQNQDSQQVTKEIQIESPSIPSLNIQNANEDLFKTSDQFFEATERTAIYVKKDGKLIRSGAVDAGQEYPRIQDYGAWHQIKFGTGIGFVKKEYTRPSDGKNIANLNKSYKNSGSKFKPLKNIAVYDNTSGSMVQFGSLYEGIEYPMISDIGSWYRVELAGRIGYVRESDVERLFSKDTRYFEMKSRAAVYIKKDGKLIKSGAFNSGQEFPRLQDYGDWHQVKLGNGIGYVKKSLTKPSDGPTIKNLNNTSLNSGISFIPLLNIAVYDNTSGSLIPFGSLYQGVEIQAISDIGAWLRVDLGGRIGFVKESDVSIKYQDIVNPRQVYTYEQMAKDIAILQSTYPDIVQKTVIGKSVDNRNIYAIKLGKGSKEIFINGAHHAREHMTTNLLMEMLDTYAYSYMLNGSVDGYNARDILNKTSIWFVPMVNPDGVTLVQKGYKSAKNPAFVLKLNNNSKDFSSWKANIRGVDLNRQYPADWGNIKNDTGKRSSKNYKGTKPLSEPEVKAVYNFTLQHKFKTAVAYHSSGEILYWNFHQNKSNYARDLKLANSINKKTGYSLVNPCPNPSGGGYTDWFIINQKMPGFTPEISPAVGARTVPLSNYNQIWKKNNSIGLMLAKEASQR
jgi:murein tripeptide amidase MpaA